MLSVDASKILDKEMNRKQFLRNVGIGIVAFTGITAVLRAVSQLPSDAPRAAVGSATAAGYGSSVYGGEKPRAL